MTDQTLAFYTERTLGFDIKLVPIFDDSWEVKINGEDCGVALKESENYYQSTLLYSQKEHYKFNSLEQLAHGLVDRYIERAAK